MNKGKWVAYFKKLGWAGFFFFLIKGLTLYVLLPYLVAKGVIDCKG